jgi:hypothetical protein
MSLPLKRIARATRKGCHSLVSMIDTLANLLHAGFQGVNLCFLNAAMYTARLSLR